MLHLVLASKAFLAAQAMVQVAAVAVTAEGSDSSDTIKVSIVGGIFLVMAAAIPAWISSRHKDGDPSTRALIRSNEQRRKEYTQLAAEHTKCAPEIDRLETLLWEAGINPHTGERVASP